MSNTYKVHYAATLAAHGKSVEFGIWNKINAAMGNGIRINPAMCKSRATQIDYTTNPDKVTCDKCAVPAKSNVPTDEERAATAAREIAKTLTVEATSRRLERAIKRRTEAATDLGIAYGRGADEATVNARLTVFVSADAEYAAAIDAALTAKINAL